jgi:putative spermidine/putrescine transport system permease protein
MSSDPNRATPIGLRISAIAGLLFLHLPLALIFLYAFTTEERSFQFPPPGYTAKWFAVAWFDRPDIWPPLYLSLRVAAIATFLALILGTLAAAALSRAKFFGRETISLLFILPIALPGIITGISLRSAFDIMGLDFSLWTIVLGHATFCIVVVYNNVVARLRRTPTSLVEASMDLGADGWHTFRYVTFPSIRNAVIAGGLLAFALSFDEIVVTNFLAGSELTIPKFIFNNLRLPRNRPVVNVVAVVVVLVMLIPVYIAQRLAGGADGVAASGPGGTSTRVEPLEGAEP